MLVITSESNEPKYHGYGKTQYRYALTYMLITSVFLVFLNFYCSNISYELFSRSKEASMVEKCQLASYEISTLDVMNTATVAQTLDQIEGMKFTRLIVTDQSCLVIYDSQNKALGTYALLPEILKAMEKDVRGSYGNDVFTWSYSSGAMDSRAATPIVNYDTISGCVYMTEYDTTQGALVQSLQDTLLRITLTLEVLVILFSIGFAAAFSKRLNRIMASMRIIQQGDYTHKLDIGGSDELTILGEEFNKLTERLHISEQKRSRFVSDASHELKTPLASIKLLSDSILQYDMDLDTVREFVGDIGDEAERLNRMTEKLLSMTKAEGKPVTESEIIYMAPTVRRVARMLQQNALQSGISFELRLEDDSPVLILEDDLYQIIYNLMENGIKYNVPGGKLTVALQRESGNAILSVSDTGMGIPEEAIGHIFERFYRVDKARSRATGGSGLGLAIVRAIVQRNRGDITVESEPGKGSDFRVTFPVFDTEVDKE